MGATSSNAFPAPEQKPELLPSQIQGADHSSCSRHSWGQKVDPSRETFGSERTSNKISILVRTSANQGAGDDQSNLTTTFYKQDASHLSFSSSPGRPAKA